MESFLDKIKHKHLSAIIIIVVSMSLFFALSACSANSERNLRSALTSDLDAIKHTKPAGLDMLVEQLAKGEQFGIDPHKFAVAWLEGLDYSIDNIDVEGNSATAEVTVTVKCLKTALDRSMPDIAKIMQGVSETDSIEDAYDRCGKIILDNLRAEQQITSSITLSYHFYGKNWVMDMQSAKELALALSSGA